MNERQRRLIERYLAGKCSEEEHELVESWMDEWAKQGSFIDRRERNQEEVSQQLFERIDRQITGREKTIQKRIRRLRLYAAVASVAVVLFSIAMFWTQHNTDKEGHRPEYVAVTPGSKGAILYSNGQEIDLTDVNGGLVLDNGMEIHAEGTAATLGSTGQEEVLNEIRVPKGGQYQLTLMDGTKVYLNSASSLVFPARFASTRRVKLEGEAYFEVNHQKAPFIVELDGHEIEVKGTSFNVKAYEKGSSYTTLVEGSVLLRSDGQGSKELVPGQQAYTSLQGIKLKNVDVRDFTSWKEGYFMFNYMNIEEVMAEISRWYDIEYEIGPGVNRGERIGGSFSREKSLDELLGYLSHLIHVKVTKVGNNVILTTEL